MKVHIQQSWTLGEPHKLSLVPQTEGEQFDLQKILERYKHVGCGRDDRRCRRRKGNRMSETNRIGEACWYKKHLGGNTWKWFPGTLRAWSTDHEEYVDSGPGLYPVAVVEDSKTLKCESIYVAHVSFAAVPPVEATA